ncbi:MAG: N-acetylneuraminate synthase family protein [Acetobacteraceae bacterium]|nr:N-acetylneuraminate synthase family protein [Acetobacteraceae bacterium]
MVGPGWPVLIVAEAGVNHGGDPARARDLVRAAAAAGADAIKFQTFRPELLVRPSAPTAAYQRGAGEGPGQMEMLSRLSLDPAELEGLFDLARGLGLVPLSTPFDPVSADLLDRLGVPAFKVSSGDLGYLPFIEYLAAKGRPLVLSTGMAGLQEVARAVRAARSAGCRELVLLQCTSAYPAAPEDANLRCLGTLSRAFGVPVGFSDHTPGVEAALAAVALGASVLEKHLTLDRSLPGPDQAASMEPQDFERMVRSVRVVEQALGSPQKRRLPSEEDVARAARRGLVALRPIRRGEALRPEAVGALRPAEGLEPRHLPQVLGRRARRDIAAGEPLTWEMFRRGAGRCGAAREAAAPPQDSAARGAGAHA